MIQTGHFLNAILASLSKKIIVPSEFHDQAAIVKDMLGNDVSGLVDVLTDFSVESASVDYTIETDNDTLNSILKKWLKTVNIEYLGRVMPGIDAVAEEYYKERWKGASFPVLKLGGWRRINGIRLPTKLLFLDGGSIYAKAKDSSKSLNVLSYDYYLTSDTVVRNKLNKDVIITNPYGRIFDQYPVPYLIKRGTYFNFKVINSLKDRQNEILEQIIPYMFLVKKGTDALATNKIKTYGQKELEVLYDKFETMINKLGTVEAGDKSTKSSLRVSNYDEQLKHLIPDLGTIFKRELFSTAEKSVLSSLGFIDIAEAVSDSRKESILNPKVFVEEIKKGVKDFKGILNTLMLLIWEENKNNVKYKNVEYKVVSSPIKGFITSDFKQEIRLLWKNGKVSSQTYCELVGELDFEIEKKRRAKEIKNGTEILMYPQITENKENDLSPEETVRTEKLTKDKKTEDVNGKPIPDDKVDKSQSKEKYTVASKGLDKDTSSKLSLDLQKVFSNAWNNANETYQNEPRAWRIAWGVIRKIGRRDSLGVWIRKKKRDAGKLKPVQLTKAMLESVIVKDDRIEKQAIEETLEAKKLELINIDLEKAKLQTKLTKQLLKGREKK